MVEPGKSPGPDIVVKDSHHSLWDLEKASRVQLASS